MTEATTTSSSSESDDGKGGAAPGDQLLWGAASITQFIKDDIGVPDFGIREAFYLLEKERLPATKVGRSWVSSRNTLRRFFAEKLDAALATALAAKLEPAATSDPKPVAPKRTDARSSKRHGRRTGRAS
jgi:hypothetical protein